MGKKIEYRDEDGAFESPCDMCQSDYCGAWRNHPKDDSFENKRLLNNIEIEKAEKALNYCDKFDKFIDDLYEYSHCMNYGENVINDKKLANQINKKIDKLMDCFLDVKYLFKGYLMDCKSKREVMILCPEIKYRDTSNIMKAQNEAFEIESKNIKVEITSHESRLKELE